MAILPAVKYPRRLLSRGLGIAVDFSLPIDRIIRCLNQISNRRAPRTIHVDNGSQYVSG